MEFKTRHIGSKGGSPASLIELYITVDNATINETVTHFQTDLVSEDLINSLKELVNEFEQHNEKVNELKE